MWGGGRCIDGLATVLLAVAAVFLAPACYDPRFKSCALLCGPAADCPQGLSCSKGHCAASGIVCSSGPDGGPADGRDASGGDTRADSRSVDHPDAQPDRWMGTRSDATGDGPDARDAPTDRQADGAVDKPPGCPPHQRFAPLRDACTAAHDLDGDGRADLLAIDATDMRALVSDGQSFRGVKWLDGAFYGATGGAFAADVTGSGFASGVAFTQDAVAIVHRSDSGFGDPADNEGIWLSQTGVGTRATFLGDLNGDGMADLVQVDDAGVQVGLSTGFNFQLPRPWISTNLGAYQAFFLADVDGDGRADLIGAGSSVDVCPSTGSSFGVASTWRSTSFSGKRGTFFADVDGDGRADGVRLEANGAWVSLSAGQEFADDARWFDVAVAGEAFSFMADADGDGRADIVSVNRANVQVALSTGTAFSAPTVWYNDTFIGEIATTVAPVGSSSCGSGR